MEFSAAQIAELLNGSVKGEPKTRITKVARIEEGEKEAISFLANPKYQEHIYTTKSSVVIVGKDFNTNQEIPATLIVVENAYESFAKLLTHFNQRDLNKSGKESPVFIDESANIGEDHYIGAFSYIGKHTQIGNGVKIFPGCYIGDNVIIGDNTTLHPGVKMYSDCILGKNCTLHSGVIIGGDGFGFAPTGGTFQKVPQIGNVIIADEVEIGSNTTVDRATIGSTKIAKGVKLDNLIQIGHNVDIGENTVIAAQVGVAGSTKIGKNCMIGGQVGIVGHLKIADGTVIAAQSGVSADTKPGCEMILGSPAIAASEYKKSYIGFRKLPRIQQRIADLEKAIEELKSSTAN